MFQNNMYVKFRILCIIINNIYFDALNAAYNINLIKKLTCVFNNEIYVKICIASIFNNTH